MFSYHMSYTELLRALNPIAHRSENCGVLTEGEWTCLSQSLQDPFLKSLLSLYPIPNRLRKIIETTIEQQRVRHPEQNQANPLYDSVHAAVYGDLRGKTEQWLRGAFPPEHFEGNLIERLQDLVKRHVREGASQDALLSQERARLKERLRKSSPKKTAYSFEEIQSDFEDYVRHIQTLVKHGSTYGLAVLSSLLVRVDSLEGEEREDVERALILGMDDARTGYHADLHKYVAGKDYSCPKGWEERMLDFMAPFRPQETVDLGAIDHTVIAMTGAFIERDLETNSRALSYPLYAAYLEAAGYTGEKREYSVRTPKDEASLNTWREKFIGAQQAKNPGTTEATQERLFDNWIKCLGVPPGLKEADLYEMRQYEEMALCPPATPRTEEDILTQIQARLPGLGLEHTILLLSLTAHATLEDGSFSLPGLNELETRAVLQEEIQAELPDAVPSPDALYAAYQHYLDLTEATFHPFFCEELLPKLEEHMQSLPCSEGALLEALDRAAGRISAEQAQNIAVLCAKEGYARALSRLFQEPYSVDPSYRSQQERKSLIELAISGNHPHVVAALIQAHPEPDFIRKKYGNFQQNVLFLAANCRSTEIVRVLLKHKRSRELIQDLDYHGHTALHKLAHLGNTEGLKLLLEHCSDTQFVQDQSAYKYTVLHYITRHRNTEGMRLILKHYPSREFIEAQDPHGETALHSVTKQGNAEGLRVLLEYNHRPEFIEAKDKKGLTALAHAASSGTTEEILILLEHKPSRESIEAQDCLGETVLHKLAKRSYTQGLKLLLEHHSDAHFVKARDNLGETVLHKIAPLWNTAGLKLILERNKSPEFIEAQNCLGETALHKLAKRADAEGLKQLLDHHSGAHFVQARDNLGETALHKLASLANIAGLKLLLERNQSLEFIEAQDCLGETALHKLAKFGYPGSLKLLLEHYSDAHFFKAQDRLGETALHKMARLGHTEGLKLLLEHNLSQQWIEAKNTEGLTALDLALWHGQRGAVKTLLSCGVRPDVYMEHPSFTVVDRESVLECLRDYYIYNPSVKNLYHYLSRFTTKGDSIFILLNFLDSIDRLFDWSQEIFELKALRQDLENEIISSIEYGVPSVLREYSQFIVKQVAEQYRDLLNESHFSFIADVYPGLIPSPQKDSMPETRDNGDSDREHQPSPLLYSARSVDERSPGPHNRR